MIQDIFPHKFSNQYKADVEMLDEDFVFYFNKSSLLVKNEGDKFQIPQKKDFSNITVNTVKTYLFSLNDISCFLVFDQLELNDKNLVYEDIGFFRSIDQPEIAMISVVGFHLKTWYDQNKFCGTCGSATKLKDDERAIECTGCKAVIYPRISPAIIVAVKCNDKILLARNAGFRNGWFSLIAGYVDIGETLIETVIREVKEEVGVSVKNVRYYKSQPWSLSGSLMIGFIAEADDNEPILVDGVEIEEAAWFSRDELPPYPPKISIAGEMIEKFEKGVL